MNAVATDSYDHCRTPSRRAIYALLAAFAVIFIWSAIRPYDYFTWLLEVFPAILGLIVLAATYRRFKFTTLVYGLIWAEAVVLLIGGHYTYAREPVFNWIRDNWHLSRNYYDRVGHFAQGFVPALVAREILLRQRVVKRGGWLVFIVISVCLAMSALYELFEWRVSVAYGSSATDFLGTQGDVWDTQEDMATALIGAIVALITLSHFHDTRLQPAPQAEAGTNATPC